MTARFTKGADPILPAGRARVLAATAAAVLMVSAGPSLAQNAPAKPAASTAGAAQAKDADPVVARVAGTDIRQSDIDLAAEDLGAQAAKMTAEQRQEYLISYVSDILRVAQAAEKDGLTKDEGFQRNLRFTRAKLLMEALLNKEGRAAVTDKAMQEVYADAIKQMKEEEEVRARHILVKTEEEARAITAELKKGGDFEAIAKEKSQDPGAAAKGGDLGYFTKAQMVPEFAEAAFKLEKGQVSEPVKSQFGWHIIRLEDKRKKPAPSFDDVKDEVETFVVRRAQAELVTNLRKETPVERLDKPATPEAEPGEKPAVKPDAEPAKKP